MTRPTTPARRQALWRSAPGRLFRTPGWFVLVLVAATLLVASVVAPPLFAGMARATALTDGIDAGAAARYGPDSPNFRVTWDQVLAEDSTDLILGRLDEMTGYSTPTLGASGVAQSRTRRAVVKYDGRVESSELWYHEGAIEALGGDENADGVWLAEDVAQRLGLEVGDSIGIGMRQTFLPDTGKLPRTVLLGTYETVPDSSLPVALSDQPDADRWFRPPDPDDPSGDTPLAIAGRRTFDNLVLVAGERPLYLADMVLDTDVTPEQAGTAVDEFHQVGSDAFDSSTELYRWLDALPIPARLSVASGLPDIVLGADQTATSARDQVRPYAVAGQVLAAALLVAGWVLLGRSRRREQLLASGLGLRPGEVAGLTTLEVLPVCLLAIPAGIALALLGLSVAGPPTEAGLTIGTEDVVRGAVAAAVALVLIAATAAGSAAATDRQSRASRLGGRRVAVPWGAALLVATVVVGIAVLGVDVVRRNGTPLAMVFPVLVAATVALGVARVAGWLASRRTGLRGAGSARWLASRRTGTVVREVTALTVVVAVALGLFGYSLTVHRGIDEGVDDKAAALVGARSMITVDEDFRGQRMPGATTPPAADTTIVWRRGASLEPAFGEAPLLAIDPRTFEDVADWGASGEMDAGRPLVSRLAHKARGVPVILAGDPQQGVGDQGTLDFSGEFQVPYQVVGVVSAFPGSESDTGRTSVIVSARRLLRLLPPTVNPMRPGASAGDAGAFTSWVWSSRTPGDLVAALDEAGVEVDGELVSTDNERVGNGLIASIWAAAYVLALGCVALVLAVAAALVLALRLADRDAVSDVLLRRMGFNSGELARSRTWEVGYAVTTAVVAAALATAVLVLAPTTIDGLATIPPLTRPRPDVADLVTMAGVLVGIVLVAWLIGAQRARHRHPAEVLRAGG